MRVVEIMQNCCDYQNCLAAVTRLERVVQPLCGRSAMVEG